jgi:hypothetical protein
MFEMLLMGHEIAQYELHQAAPTAPDLTEEIALFIEVDRLLWNDVSKAMQGALESKAWSLGEKEPDSMQRLHTSIVRLQTFSQMSDEPATWLALADELATYDMYAGQTLDLERLAVLRAKLKEILHEPEAPPAPATETVAEAPDGLPGAVEPLVAAGWKKSDATQQEASDGTVDHYAYAHDWEQIVINVRRDKDQQVSSWSVGFDYDPQPSQDALVFNAQKKTKY